MFKKSSSISTAGTCTNLWLIIWIWNQVELITLYVCVYSCCKYDILSFNRVAQGQPEVPPSVVGHPPQLPLHRTPLPHRWIVVEGHWERVPGAITEHRRPLWPRPLYPHSMLHTLFRPLAYQVREHWNCRKSCERFGLWT